MPPPIAAVEARVRTDLSARRVAEIGEYVGELTGADVHLQGVDTNGMDFDIRTGPAERLRFRLGIVETPDGTAAQSRVEERSKSSEAGLLLYQRFVAEFVDTVRREDPHAVTAIHGGEHPG